MTSKQKYPIPSAEQENIEEALVEVWEQFEKGVTAKADILPLIEQTADASTYQHLLDQNLVRESGGALTLTDEGRKRASDVTRRQRLAERLLTDVLAVSSHAVDPTACKLEHVISDEVAESICTLLGHPEQCPHGSPIPRGECCSRGKNSAESVAPIITSLDKLTAGEKGKISYILLENHPDLHKLLSLGLVPGTGFTLHQTFPSTVLEVGETTLALEEEIAQKIYVRRTE